LCETLLLFLIHVLTVLRYTLLLLLLNELPLTLL
jgi:hypothetical protein